MTPKRSTYQIEFLAVGGVRLELTGDQGWRVKNIRQLGERDRVAALALVERAQACLPPAEPEPAAPPTLLEVAEYAARELKLRITHRRTKQK